ncbi:OBP3-responsive protein 4 isoform 5 [Hibiscus syriacus]|uniref:OBP3-responsive protein 4 isoform 5 n=1 Tax=Hibiscus syriacus TaxID=106335 RepID=A0A6A2Y2Z3_HIBSY|nr:OBP3-responsive protein 4 isoform 5 [Hibiscus syriacus]
MQLDGNGSSPPVWGDGVSRIRNKTTLGLVPGLDFRFGWRSVYVLPEATGALGTDEPLFNLNSGRLQASLDRVEAIVTHLSDREKSSISMLKTTLEVKEAKLFARVECGVFIAMSVMQLLVLALSFAVHHCWVREYGGLEAERESTAKKRSRRLQRVQE